MCGILLGLAAIDNEPYGLGWSKGESTHYFSALDMRLPRWEVRQRAMQTRAVDEWLAGSGGDTVHTTCEAESLRRIAEVAEVFSTEVLASYDGVPVDLEPFDQAMVPVVWGYN